ncbi:MAG: transketolase family protein, partial [Nitrospinae bacterium]|nr:transketolase family protein [Nitrospinota bacterium]
KLNVKIVATYGGLCGGKNGPTHLAIEDIAIMRAIPNMVVIEPADFIETEIVIRTIVKYKGPVYVRLGRDKEPQIFKEGHNFNIGKGIIIKDGKDITFITMGIMVARTLKASEILEKEGINVRVINMPTIKPIDEEIIIKSAQETSAIVTIEEHNIIGGLGDAVAEVIVENISVPMKRVGIKDTFTESGENEDLRNKYGLTVENIVTTAKHVLERKLHACV